MRGISGGWVMRPIDPLRSTCIPSALMNLPTPALAIDIRTSVSGRNATNPKPDDQISLSFAGRSFGSGRVTSTGEGNVVVAWVRIGNGKISEGDDVQVFLNGGHSTGNGRIIAATDGFLEINYTLIGNKREG